MRPLAVAIFSLACLPLAACFDKDNKPATVINGECRIFERAEYAYKGKTQHDQLYIDKQIEAGVRGCGYERPKPRPQAWDAKPVVVKAPIPKPAPKAGLLDRFRGHRP